jgi:hypothetical protein
VTEGDKKTTTVTTTKPDGSWTTSTTTSIGDTSGASGAGNPGGELPPINNGKSCDGQNIPKGP